MTSNISVSGAVSGIDTASLINQLMTVEAQSQTAIKDKQTAAQKAADAYTTLITSLQSFATQAASVAKTSAWQGSTATSSASSVTATATGNAQGTLTFDVSAVAAAHTLISASAVNSTGAVVAGSSLTISDKSNNVKGTINVGGGTLSEVVAGINGSSLGLRAAAVQTSPGNYRLQVTSATAGADSEFKVSGLTGFTGGTNGTNVLTQGTDALLTVGDPSTTGYTVTSPSNTFSNLIPGVSFTVSKQETNVTIDSKIDGTAIATSISALVDAANTALKSIDTQTAYDFTTKTGAALYGENGLKSIQQSILSAVSSSAAPGVQLTRDGTLTFDKAAFLKGFQADPAATAAAYGAKSSFTPNTGVLGRAALLAGQTTTRGGTYAIGVSVAAAKEQWTVTPPDPTQISGKVISITQGSLTASYTIGASDTLAQAAAAINTRAAAAGIGATAAVNGSSIAFGAINAGTGGAFSVTYDGAAGNKTQAGRDVVGTIDGKVATGLGSILTLNNKASGANGLSLDTSFSDADVSLNSGAVGSVTYTPGLAQKLSTLISDATGSDGSLTQAKSSQLAAVKDFQDQIDAWDLRLQQRRDSLTKQFTAMETAIAALKSQSTSITNLLSSGSSSSSSSSSS